MGMKTSAIYDTEQKWVEGRLILAQDEEEPSNNLKASSGAAAPGERLPH